MPSLEITTQIGCPLMCTFCPQDKLAKAYKDPVRKMTVETFQTVLNKLPLDYKIIFAGYTEPWANPLCSQFVLMALERNFNISIYSTLYNIDITQANDLAELLEKHHKQVDEFWIHLPDKNSNMRGFKYSEEYENVLRRMLSMKKISVYSMTMDAESIINPSIKTNVKPVNWYLHTRADNLTISDIRDQLINPPPKYEYIVECTRDKDLKSNILLPNGDVILCCMDYGLKHRLGNLLKSTLDEVINGSERLSVLELSGQLGYTDELLCKSCNDALCHTPWNNKKVYELVLAHNPEFKL